MDMQLHF